MNVFNDAWSDETGHRKYRRTAADAAAEQASEQAFNNFESYNWRLPDRLQQMGSMAVAQAEPAQQDTLPPPIEHPEVA